MRYRIWFPAYPKGLWGFAVPVAVSGGPSGRDERGGSCGVGSGGIVAPRLVVVSSHDLLVTGGRCRLRTW